MAAPHYWRGLLALCPKHHANRHGRQAHTPRRGRGVVSARTRAVPQRDLAMLPLVPFAATAAAVGLVRAGDQR